MAVGVKQSVGFVQYVSPESGFCLVSGSWVEVDAFIEIRCRYAA